MRFCSQHFTSLSASCLERGLNWKLSGLLRFFPFIFRVDIKNSVNVLWMSSSLSSHLRYVAIEKLRTLQKWTFQSKNPHWPVCHTCTWTQINWWASFKKKIKLSIYDSPICTELSSSPSYFIIYSLLQQHFCVYSDNDFVRYKGWIWEVRDAYFLWNALKAFW